MNLRHMPLGHMRLTPQKDPCFWAFSGCWKKKKAPIVKGIIISDEMVAQRQAEEEALKRAVEEEACLQKGKAVQD
ncbi:hypothetical protein QYF36_008147 [Acer negundo]|nr:hypothetical protein QYF36_008147 [Acer negundo]